MSILPLNQGGTGSDLSTTGGAKQFVKQTSAGSNLSVATISNTDVSGITSLASLNSLDTVTIFADRMPGADNSAKIANAIAAIAALLPPNSGGIVDARNLQTEASGGSQVIDPHSTRT
jgi:hypothetical protein